MLILAVICSLFYFNWRKSPNRSVRKLLLAVEAGSFSQKWLYLQVINYHNNKELSSNIREQGIMQRVFPKQISSHRCARCISIFNIVLGNSLFLLGRRPNSSEQTSVFPTRFSSAGHDLVHLGLPGVTHH